MSILLKAGPLRWLADLLTSARYVVHGDSMIPSFHPEQYILVRRLGRGKGPNRGDVVVFQHRLRPGITFVKRVVGLPGDRVIVRGSQVYIDGTRLYEPYLGEDAEAAGLGEIEPPEGPDSGAEWTLQEDQYFVLGDNRSHSRGSRPEDSRRFGPVELGSIIGAAWFRYWPPSAWGYLRPST